MLDTPYVGDLLLIKINDDLSNSDFTEQHIKLATLVEQLIKDGLVVANQVTEKIFQNINDIHTVADMADVFQLSPHQLHRNLKRTTGLAPHDFLKILRLQQVLNCSDTSSYADQSLFIHSCRKATGYTPGKYLRKFDV